jgi:thiol-disulfide isomerase/thioredoxin
MNHKLIYILGGVAVLVVIAVVIVWTTRPQMPGMPSAATSTSSSPSLTSETSTTSSTSSTSSTASSSVTLIPVQKLGFYRDYKDGDAELANSGKVVLFFHAAWCPSCRALENDINSSLNDIPSDVAILKVNFDSATALRQLYGVTTQHTLVQIGPEGNSINKLAGLYSLYTLESVLSGLI